MLELTSAPTPPAVFPPPPLTHPPQRVLSYFCPSCRLPTSTLNTHPTSVMVLTSDPPAVLPSPSRYSLLPLRSSHLHPPHSCDGTHFCPSCRLPTSTPNTHPAPPTPVMVLTSAPAFFPPPPRTPTPIPVVVLTSVPAFFPPPPRTPTPTPVVVLASALAPPAVFPPPPLTPTHTHTPLLCARTHFCRLPTSTPNTHPHPHPTPVCSYSLLPSSHLHPYHPHTPTPHPCVLVLTSAPAPPAPGRRRGPAPRSPG